MRKLISLVAIMAASVRARAALADWDWLTQYKESNLHYGQLALHPYYKLAEMYDSNIFLVPHDQPSGQVGGGVRSSWITKNNVGVETSLPWRHINRLDLGYDLEHDHYTTEPSINDTVNQSAHADFVRQGAQGMTYQAGDQYINTTDQAFSELIQRKRRWNNRVYAAADYAPRNGRLTGGVDADHVTDKYLDAALGALLNRYQEDFGGNVGYMVQPKTKVYVSYHRGIIHYTVDPVPGQLEKNSKSHTVAFGVAGKLTEKIEGRIEGGYAYREYDVAPIVGTPRVHRSGTAATSVAYKPDESSKIALTVSRYLQESIDANNPFYYANDVLLDVEHKFPHKFTAAVHLAMSIDQYQNDQTFVAGGPAVNRRDDLYQGAVSIEYDIQKWLSTGASYAYRELDSTMSGEFNYQDSQVTWYGSLKF